jgi:hypothetical protein
MKAAVSSKLLALLSRLHGITFKKQYYLHLFAFAARERWEKTSPAENPGNEETYSSTFRYYLYCSMYLKFFTSACQLDWSVNRYVAGIHQEFTVNIFPYVSTQPYFVEES